VASTPKLYVRELYKSTSKESTHVVQSTEVATASVCPFLFKLSYPFGVVSGDYDYLTANTIHDIMSLATSTTLLDNWLSGVTDFEAVAKSVVKDSESIIEKAEENSIDLAKRNGRETVTLDDFDNQVHERFHGLIVGLAKRIMKKHPIPKRAITEITITNIRNVHEGRIDAILEFDDDTYGIIDWKTNKGGSVTGGGKDAWQLLANLLLGNYRYTKDENNWNKCRFGAVIYDKGAYVPRLPISQRVIDKVKNDREFAHQVLCGGSPYVQKPVFCPVCDKDGDSAKDCRFYRNDTRLAKQGVFPSNYDEIRRLLIKRRYLILRERAETHRHKFVFDSVIKKLGEEDGLGELERSGVIHGGFKIISVEGRSISLTSQNIRTFLEPRKAVRIIGIEKSSIPVLACVNEGGIIKSVDYGKIIVDLPTGIAAERAKSQLSGLPLIIMPNEVNLTRRVLEPMDKFHRLAADLLLKDADD
jgi:hypothetical protein